MFFVIGGLSMMSHHYTLGNIKSRTVGDGQHGTARWATDKEIKQTYAHVPFKVREWRRGQNLPTEQGLIFGCKGKPHWYYFATSLAPCRPSMSFRCSPQAAPAA